MSGKHWTWLSVMSLFAAAASVGISPFCGSGCGPSMVVDPVTGATRPATQEDIYAQMQPGEQALQPALAAAGHPEWYLFLDAGTRIGALLVALYGGWKIPAPVGSQPQGWLGINRSCTSLAASRLACRCWWSCRYWSWTRYSYWYWLPCSC